MKPPVIETWETIGDHPIHRTYLKHFETSQEITWPCIVALSLQPWVRGISMLSWTLRLFDSLRGNAEPSQSCPREGIPRSTMHDVGETLKPLLFWTVLLCLNPVFVSGRQLDIARLWIRHTIWDCANENLWKILITPESLRFLQSLTRNGVYLRNVFRRGKPEGACAVSAWTPVAALTWYALIPDVALHLDIGWGVFCWIIMAQCNSIRCRSPTIWFRTAQDGWISLVSRSRSQFSNSVWAVRFEALRLSCVWKEWHAAGCTGCFSCKS